MYFDINDCTMYFDINDCTMYFDSFTISDTGCDSSPECNAVLRPAEKILTNAPLEANMTTGKKTIWRCISS